MCDRAFFVAPESMAGAMLTPPGSRAGQADSRPNRAEQSGVAVTDKFTVVGSIGADPERRTTKGGDPFITFSVASNERRQDAEGNWVDVQTSWFDVSAFGALGRHSGDALHRGDRVIVLGDLTVAQYATAGGGKGRSVKIRATAIGHDLTMGGPRTPRMQPAGRASDESADRTARSTPQVDHSDEWAPIDSAPFDSGELRPAPASDGVPVAEPAWMSTPF